METHDAWSSRPNEDYTASDLPRSDLMKPVACLVRTNFRARRLRIGSRLTCM